MRFLVVDDNELIRRTLAGYLEDEGHAVIEARDGQEAVTIVAHQTFDAVLMDIQMPQMDGIAATMMLRQMPACTSLPIFAFTGLPQSVSMHQALFTTVLLKPMSPADVLEAIKPHLQP